MKKTTFFVVAIVGSGIGIANAQEPVQTAPAASPQAAAPAAAAIKVEKIAIGSGIDNKEISGEAAQFGGSVGRLYCWTKISAEQTPATIKHVWSADGKKEAEVSLNINYPATRTWSSKSVWPGSWKVDVTDDKGAILASKEFTVTQDPPQTGQ